MIGCQTCERPWSSQSEKGIPSHAVDKPFEKEFLGPLPKRRKTTSEAEFTFQKPVTLQSKPTGTRHKQKEWRKIAKKTADIEEEKHPAFAQKSPPQVASDDIHIEDNFLDLEKPERQKSEANLAMERFNVEKQRLANLTE